MDFANIGTNFPAYVPPFMVALLVVVAIYTVYTTITKAMAASRLDDGKARFRAGRLIIIRLFMFGAVIALGVFIMFGAYGLGRPITTVKESGQMEVLDEVPPERMSAEEQKTDEVVRRDKTGTLGEVGDPEALRKDEERNAKIIEEALKRAKGE